MSTTEPTSTGALYVKPAIPASTTGPTSTAETAEESAKRGNLTDQRKCRAIFLALVARRS
eukprot:9242146-Pyramimonas_sp.AAC.1